MAVKTEPKTTPTIAARKDRYTYAHGKRKTAIARVRMYHQGKGTVLINDLALNDYFFGILIGKVLSPLKLTNTVKQFDLTIEVLGGGPSAQADACCHGIAKALMAYDPALRSSLKQAGYITRDARIKERKKFGLKRARRAPQWSKR